MRSRQGRQWQVATTGGLHLLDPHLLKRGVFYRGQPIGSIRRRWNHFPLRRPPGRPVSAPHMFRGVSLFKTSSTVEHRQARPPSRRSKPWYQRRRHLRHLVSTMSRSEDGPLHRAPSGNTAPLVSRRPVEIMQTCGSGAGHSNHVAISGGEAANAAHHKGSPPPSRPSRRLRSSFPVPGPAR